MHKVGEVGRGCCRGSGEIVYKGGYRVRNSREVCYVNLARNVSLEDVESSNEDRGEDVILHSSFGPRPDYGLVVDLEDDVLVSEMSVY